MQADDDVGADALARRLAGVHLELAHARDDRELLAAVVHAVLPYGPAVADLHHLYIDERGAPARSQPVVLWTPEAGLQTHPLVDQRFEFATLPLSNHWIDAPDQALVVVDNTTDPRCDAGVRALLAPLRATVILPLHSSHPSAWQGMVTLHWYEPHTPDDDERLVYRLLLHTLAAFIADRRALQAHTAALAEVRALYRLSARITAARSSAELLAAVVEEAQVPGAQGKLLTIETGPEGQPETLTVAAVHGGGPTAAATLGFRHVIAALPSARLWLDMREAAGFIADVAADPRIDEVSRAVHLRSGLGSAVLLPLRWQGHWLGLLQIGWVAPRAFSPEERRLYTNIAPQVAAVLDNRLLAERSERALAVNRDQARTLEIVLDHLPIGVMINDVAAGQRRVNRAGADLLEDDHPDSVRPIPLFHPGTDRPVDPRERLSRLAMETGEIVTRERDLQDPDGSRRRLGVTAAPIRGEDGTITGAITLFHDITHHVAAERERAELQDAIIAAQRAALAERATPLIPISDEILVLPIVGAIDPDRGRQLVDTLVHLGGHARARVVLIDLTGVRELDAAGARALAEGAAALRLRGALPIVTGIAAGVAWSLVEQDLALHATTHTTLQAGLAHAERLLGR